MKVSEESENGDEEENGVAEESVKLPVGHGTRDRRRQAMCIGTISRRHVTTRQTDCNLRANVATHARTLPAHREFAGHDDIR